MCTGTTTHADIRVSVQDRNARDRAAGHLAAAVLVDGDAVLVPNPRPELLDPATELEILIFPADPTAHLPVERIDAWKWSPFQLTGAKEPLATVGRLRHHSRYSAQIGEVDPRELAAATQEHGGDLWAALDQLAAVPPGIGDISGELLTEISRVEREQRRPRRSAHQFDSYDQLVGGFCVFFCFCGTHGTK
ncbi:hypothetical protein O7623_26925 [Solwaraspora sp. WMMD791]|uniref:hypothetical protein n=1 Tax=Solwaraspora sp. WMMD791 TaxID=3016086 RepID=UPI00249C719E|nr:hypothetical protein [Solwaraspora sp. WMMD791]WFE26863.1 hypothetical protein O7623_26925 [Solwaraspora sp. WMMD791]